ncbi:ANKRD50, partial [Symbiodinium microadriaticum]
KLLDKGAEKEDRDEAGRTVLALASAAGRSEVVKLLLERKAEVEAPDRAGLTPLHWAAKEGHKKEVVLLLEAGANIQAADEDGMTPIKLAALFNQLEVTRELVSRGVDPSPALELVKRFNRCAKTAAYLKEAVASSSTAA